MECWQNFIEKSEIEQKEIIQKFSNSVQDHKCDNTGKEKPGKISSRIKRTFKIRKNLSIEIVKCCEEDLISFFQNTPSDIYIKHPPTSFDRLLLHGIAQYHRLHSISMYFIHKFLLWSHKMWFGKEKGTSYQQFPISGIYLLIFFN